jgi:uncharacterized protein YkwD
MKPTWPLWFGLLIVSIVLVGRLDDASAQVKPQLGGLRAELLKLHNRLREEAKQKPLVLNTKLCRAAQQYPEYLAKSGEFSHTAKGTMRSRVEDAGYERSAVGENIARGQESPGDVVAHWLESKVHQDNILSEEFSDVGFGVAADEERRTIWVTNFGGGAEP